MIIEFKLGRGHYDLSRFLWKRKFPKRKFIYGKGFINLEYPLGYLYIPHNFGTTGTSG